MMSVLRRNFLVGSVVLWTSAAWAEKATLSDGLYLVAEGVEVAGAIALPDRGGGSEFLRPELLMSFREVAEVDVERQRPETGFYVVMLTLTDAGRAQFSALTEAHIRERIAIVLRDEVITAPMVYERIDGGVFQIDGALSREEARELARYLRAGD
jgi:preprotein translocase subunit SecD